jgi:dTDP-glucose 4,6-dehydratase
MNHTTILITGGCGAMGSVMINYFTEKYPYIRFVNLDLLTYCGHETNIVIRPNYKLYKGNICNTELVKTILEIEQPTCIIHLAAETHVDTSFGNSMKFTETNVLGTHNLLECVKSYGKLKLFLHMSTDEVYGSVGLEDCLKETANFAPSNPYAATKVGAEMLCYSYKYSFNLPIIITRCNNIISPFQDQEKLIPKCIYSLHKNELIPVHGDGSSLRTFIDAYDVSTAIETIIINYNNIINCENNQQWIYNIGTNSSHEFTVLDVIKHIISIVKNIDYNSIDINNYINYIEDRPFQDKRYCIDSTIIRNLGWCEKYSFIDSIQSLVNK